MALKKRYASLDEVPEALRSSYRKEGGAYVLDLADDGDDEPDDSKRRVDEFRATNRKLMAEAKAKDELIESLKKRTGAMGDHGDEEVSTALKLLAAVQNEADADLIKAGKFDDVVARRMKARESDWAKKLEAEQTARKKDAEAASKARERASGMLLERALRAKIAEKKLRLRPTAEEDLLLRATRDFRIPDDLEGDPVAVAEGGPDVGAWLDKLAVERPHLWEGGEGGGTKGGAKGAVGGVRVVRRSDLSDLEYGKLAPEIAAGTVRVVAQ